MNSSNPAQPEDDPPRRRQSPEADLSSIPGDPGVGGLLADPEAPVGPHDHRQKPTGAASPDPEPPKAHGDWLPTHRSQHHREH